MSLLHHSTQNKTPFETQCAKKGLRMTSARRIIAQVIWQSTDHPDVQEIHRRALAHDEGISLATIYRTLRVFYEMGILERHAFVPDNLKGNRGRWRYEIGEKPEHYHLIDTQSGEVIEFESAELAKLQKSIARKLGYELDSHCTELYGVALKQKRGSKKNSKKQKTTENHRKPQKTYE